MSHLLVSNEHEMEVSIKYITKVAKLDGKTYMTLSFPSGFLAKTFMDNLVDNFIEEEVPNDTQLELDIIIPKG